MSFHVWEYERGGEMLRAAKLIAVGKLEPPGLEIELIAGVDAHVTALITSGKLRDRSSILYVEEHGTFEIERVEPWLDGGRILLLRRWPGPG